MTASLYLHIPFCSRLCDYCDFYSIPADADLMDSYITALLEDVDDQVSLFNIDTIPSIYIGGGTPSVLGAARMALLLAGLKKVTDTEFTVEANPESADEDFLRACVDGGVNRLSLGVQSFYAPSLRTVGRAAGVPPDQRLELAARYFPGAFSADIITGLPHQNTDILLNDIEHLLSYKPAHVSLYSFTVEPETPFGKKAALLGEAALSLPDGDDADNLWITGRDYLEKAGYAQYEVSAFSLPGKTCAHNLRYWHMENWLGAGAAASGTLIEENNGSCRGKRYTHPQNVAQYLSAPRPRILSAQTEELEMAGLIRETFLTGFRCLSGPDTALFSRRFGTDIPGCIPRTVQRWRDNGLLEITPGRTALTREGLLFLNRFLREAFDELDTE